MRIILGAALAVSVAFATAQAAPTAAQGVARQCLTNLLAWHAKHPNDPLPTSCPGVKDYETHVLGSWSDVDVRVSGPGGMGMAMSAKGDAMMGGSMMGGSMMGGGSTMAPRMRMSDKVCTPDNTYCCVWDDDKHPPRCGINTGGPLLHR
ncbi:MAG TPA: hypothetical protein VKB71_10035 [Rhizomicrobium sp.]|nr:hypothetical protein [Rhizomicrobium sp.]